MPSMRMMEMAKNLKILFEMNARAGDTVFVLSDSAQDADVWMAVATAGRFHGCEITVALMADPRETHLDPPPTHERM